MKITNEQYKQLSDILENIGANANDVEKLSAERSEIKYGFGLGQVHQRLWLLHNDFKTILDDAKKAHEDNLLNQSN